MMAIDELQEDQNTYGTIRKRKNVNKPQPLPPGVSNTLTRTNGSTALGGDSAPKRKKPLPMAPQGKENTGDNAPMSCSKLGPNDEMKKVLPNSPSHVLSPKQRRISKGKRSMSPKPVRASARFDAKVCSLISVNLLFV